jgi:hypothetical protein
MDYVHGNELAACLLNAAQLPGTTKIIFFLPLHTVPEKQAPACPRNIVPCHCPKKTSLSDP